MDFSYITPRCLPQLDDRVLLESLIEYRKAAELLAGDESPDSQDLHVQLMAAIRLLREELHRREVHGVPSV